jgi:hypothetical protein
VRERERVARRSNLAYFKDAQEVYDTLGKLFQDLVTDDELAPNVTVALARGQIKAKGPVAKILKLVPLTKPVFPRYKAQLERQRRTDLIDA